MDAELESIKVSVAQAEDAIARLRSEVEGLRDAIAYIRRQADIAIGVSDGADAEAATVLGQVIELRKQLDAHVASGAMWHRTQHAIYLTTDVQYDRDKDPT